MPIAHSILPDRFEDDRHGAILRGLGRAGYKVKAGKGPPTDDRDVLVTWTIHRGHKEVSAKAFEAAGGRVIVCEEGYIRKLKGERWFAIALHEHNGGGQWPYDGPERWASFRIELKPWRLEGDYILVCGQRGIGSTLMASPRDWHGRVMERLRSVRHERPIHLRTHPKSRGGEPLPTTSLDQDLARAFAVVIWSSNVGVRSLIEGIPVFYDAPHVSLEGAAEKGIENANDPSYGERLPAFQRMAWGQWSVEEIKSGFAFDFLLNSRNEQSYAPTSCPGSACL